MTELDCPSEALRARLLAAAARQPAIVPGTWGRRLLGYALLGAAWIVVATAVLGVRPDWRQLWAGAATLLALGAVAVAASVAGLSRGRAMVGASSELLLVFIAGLPLALLGIVLGVAPGMVPPASGSAATALAAIKCDLLVAAVAVPLLGCAWAVVRGLTLSRPRLSGACAGLAAATWAHAVVRVHCAVPGASHAVIGHLVPALPLMCLAAWVFSAPGPVARSVPPG